MANLEQIIANKNASDTQWQHQQQADRGKCHRNAELRALK